MKLQRSPAGNLIPAGDRCQMCRTSRKKVAQEPDSLHGARYLSSLLPAAGDKNAAFSSPAEKTHTGKPLPTISTPATINSTKDQGISSEKYRLNNGSAIEDLL
ncbi:MAG TPA: hypothetical protein VGN63_22910 [Flavisolibacter sp.]|jgi:hypothetical protein|nr:hypothetical protein [Flavisolibacter sp.]